MGDARRRQELADSWVRAAQKNLAKGRPEVAVSCLGMALGYRPWDKLKVSPELAIAWNAQHICQKWDDFVLPPKEA